LRSNLRAKSRKRSRKRSKKEQEEGVAEICISNADLAAIFFTKVIL
jgi:hypothetical protein